MLRFGLGKKSLEDLIRSISYYKNLAGMSSFSKNAAYRNEYLRAFLLHEVAPVSYFMIMKKPRYLLELPFKLF